jgi:8-oxo-dGTP pyrophosphatase MutT (NUDIX family)
MKRIALFIGRLSFYVGWPVLYALVRRSKRSRVVILCDDEVLLVRGWLSGDSAWSLPGGGVHRGEQPVVGAVREVYEELGVHLQPSDLSPIGSDTQVYKGLPSEYHYFGVKLAHKPSLKLSRIELCDARWYSLEDMNEIGLQPAVHFALTRWLVTKKYVNL